ncbi:MAG: 5-deoxy-glucuronate isomerase [Lachnospiraceae bacterium]|nr:5-deoxy-glucuronate isomerase [Lachnospiraceae bacterium]
MILTTYDNAYRDMLMDIRMYDMKPEEERGFERPGEEIAVLLFSGRITFSFEGEEKTVSRKDVFTEGPWCVHVCKGKKITVKAHERSEILVQCAENDREFESRLFAPEDAPWRDVCRGKFGDTANRRVNTIFDDTICPESNMVLGEVLNDRGNWSGYLPHQHVNPETYLFKFDRPEGFGASFVGDQVFKSVNNSFSAIPGGVVHPQVAAPGFQMYTCWMIRHLEEKRWLQTDRCEDETYVWLHDAKF